MTAPLLRKVGQCCLIVIRTHPVLARAVLQKNSIPFYSPTINQALSWHNLNPKPEL